jgi:hypothetical protein
MQDDPHQASRPSGTSIVPEAEAPAEREEHRQHERRRSLRYPVSASLEAVELQSKARFNGRISDLSLGGCYVDTMSTCPAGSVLKIRITSEGKLFETRARVIVSSAGMGMSLMFTETESEQFATLEGWIRELSGELVPSEPELPQVESRQSAEPASNIAQVEALNELISELMRTGVLSDLKGKALLRKLPRR